MIFFWLDAFIPSKSHIWLNDLFCQEVWITSFVITMEKFGWLFGVFFLITSNYAAICRGLKLKFSTLPPYVQKNSLIEIQSENYFK